MTRNPNPPAPRRRQRAAQPARRDRHMVRRCHAGLLTRTTLRRATAAALLILSTGCATTTVAVPVATGSAGLVLGFNVDPPGYVHDPTEYLHRRQKTAAVGTAIGVAFGLAVALWIEKLIQESPAEDQRR